MHGLDSLTYGLVMGDRAPADVTPYLLAKAKRRIGQWGDRGLIKRRVDAGQGIALFGFIRRRLVGILPNEAECDF